MLLWQRRSRGAIFNARAGTIMLLPGILVALTCLFMILGVLFFPKICLFGRSFSSFWIVTTIGAGLLLGTGCVSLPSLGAALFSDSAVNPLKILVLFISMTLLSVYLDEVGFFRYLATRMLRYAGNSRRKLFWLLYLTVSVLTVFTSNDIIILSFTPFICYFCAAARIDPIPYLTAEFVAANTWSMALIIGNPTNIYLASAAGVGFFEYMKVMFLPTIAAGTVAGGAVYLLFSRSLHQPMKAPEAPLLRPDRAPLIIGVAHLGICTLLLAVGGYIGLPMWAVAACALFSLCLFVAALGVVRRSPPVILLRLFRRAPWELIPFLLSMFTLVIALGESGITGRVSEMLPNENNTLLFGVASFLAANLVNNIPMSVLFSPILSSLSAGSARGALYATVAGSNIGAFFTPIGALAGIMFSAVLREHGVQFGFARFLRMGAAVAVPALLAALGVLCLTV